MTTAGVRLLTLVGALMAALVVPASPASSTVRDLAVSGCVVWDRYGGQVTTDLTGRRD